MGDFVGAEALLSGGGALLGPYTNGRTNKDRRHLGCGARMFAGIKLVD
jgi:hypothetical protein